MTESVRTFADYGPQFFPLPHPSWRSVPWMQQNRWFEARVLPKLREVVRTMV
jgi:uracil-DNA glycosylase